VSTSITDLHIATVVPKVTAPKVTPSLSAPKITPTTAGIGIEGPKGDQGEPAISSLTVSGGLVSPLVLELVSQVGES
jgi:hypothetical protein